MNEGPEVFFEKINHELVNQFQNRINLNEIFIRIKSETTVEIKKLTFNS